MHTIIFDWKRTLYDPDSKALVSGAQELIRYLNQKKFRNILVGKGGTDMYQEVKRLKIEKYFAKIIFKEGKKDIEIFSQFFSRNNPKSTVVVGDRVRSEIEIGNKLNMTTIWIKQGKFSKELPLNETQKPTFTINSLNDLSNFFRLKFKKQILA